MSNPAPTIDDYLSLIPSQHRDKPKFVSLFTGLAESYIAVQQTILGYIEDFDVNLAVGVQLDQVGLWVGASRVLKEPITGVFFTFDSAVVGETWDTSIWKAKFENTDTMYVLSDPLYRILIQLKILENKWDASIPGLYAIWDTVFADNDIDLYIQDNQDMTFDVYFVGSFSEAEKRVIEGSGLFPRPAGVKLNYNFSDTPPI